ncbi:regulator of G-protein signaling 21-like isoform X2 [Nerophis ophidion]|uniref:regulator of G-protein signaling 21-like isoform X2 n=1 Tax=Nerophis ophidion TaxID=159077 RepID=UPI002ADFB76B|nr:regulator of G-protein signaling 21-like isoform X2 [Nerophis ophidion]
MKTDSSRHQVTERKSRLRLTRFGSHENVSQHKKTPSSSISAEAALQWSESFEELMKNSDGVETFSRFLHTEFSEENLEFWLACEEFKTLQSDKKLPSKAKHIYGLFIQADAPKEAGCCCCCLPQDPLEDRQAWTQSVDKVLASKAGQVAFREFLRSEHSEENLQFWLACEDYKKIKSVPEMITCANRIYSDFVHTEAPRQINIDCQTREKISRNMSQPSPTSFDAAQKTIYCLMSRDCYPRFLNSDICARLLMTTPCLELI